MKKPIHKRKETLKDKRFITSRKEFVNRMHEVVNYGGVNRFTKENCMIAYNAFIATMILELEKGTEIYLDRLGSFEIRYHKPYRVYSRDKESTWIKPGFKRIVFVPESALKKSVFELSCDDTEDSI